MIRFTKPDGSNFDLDYFGPFHCVDSNNTVIAKCVEKLAVFKKMYPELAEVDAELEEELNSDSWKNAEEDINEKELGPELGDPSQWDDWELVGCWADVEQEDEGVILRRSIASAYSVLETVTRITVCKTVDPKSGDYIKE